MTIEDRNLGAGTVLVAKYKGQEHRVLVLDDGRGKLGYELDGETIFKSLSAAGKQVMGGVACNGWRFWSVEGEEPEPKANRAPGATGAATKAASKEKPARPAKVRQIKRVPNQKGVEDGQVKWFCSACQRAFLAPTGEEPATCPEGHGRETVDELAPVS